MYKCPKKIGQYVNFTSFSISFPKMYNTCFEQKILTDLPFWTIQTTLYPLEPSRMLGRGRQPAQQKEISGLPDVIEDDILESTVVSILNKIVDKPIDASTEVEACHRIGGKRGFKGTLIRFVNRKRSDEIKSNRSKMNQVNLETFNIPAHNKIYLNDNLSPLSRSLTNVAR